MSSHVLKLNLIFRISMKKCNLLQSECNDINLNPTLLCKRKIEHFHEGLRSGGGEKLLGKK